MNSKIFKYWFLANYYYINNKIYFFLIDIIKIIGDKLTKINNKCATKGQSYYDRFTIEKTK